MYRHCFYFHLLAFLLPMALTPLLASPNDDNSDHVVIALNDWVSQRVLSRVIGSLIQDTGIKVSYQDILVDDQWGALTQGIVDIQVEIWQETMADPFESFVQKGLVLDLGSHQAKGREDWWYPKYVEKLCPGLPDWRAFSACSALFSTKSSSGKGVFYTGAWGNKYGTKIRALKLDFIIKRLTDDLEIWRLLQQATVQKRPIVIYNWSPNWTDTRLEGKFVEFPRYDENCHTNPDWGINQGMLHDCGAPVAGWIKKAASRRLKLTYPCLYRGLVNVDFTGEMMADAAALVVIDKLSESEAVHKWKEKYILHWQAWFELSC